MSFSGQAFFLLNQSISATKLARYHDITNGSGVVLVETDDPTLVIQHVYGWIDLCEATVIPVVDDEGALELLNR